MKELHSLFETGKGGMALLTVQSNNNNNNSNNNNNNNNMIKTKSINQSINKLALN